VPVLISSSICHEDVWGSEDIAPLFLTSAQDGREWSVSGPVALLPGEGDPDVRWIGLYVGPTPVQIQWRRDKLFVPTGNSSPALQPVYHRYLYIYIHICIYISFTAKQLLISVSREIDENNGTINVSYDNYYYCHNHHTLVLATLESIDPKTNATINNSIIYWLTRFMLFIWYHVYKIHM
jgi:hypothetical protein